MWRIICLRVLRTGSSLAVQIVRSKNILKVVTSSSIVVATSHVVKMPNLAQSALLSHQEYMPPISPAVEIP